MKTGKIAVLYNYQGAMIRRFQLNADKNHFDINDLPGGVYMVVIRNPNGQGRSYKIIRE